MTDAAPDAYSQYLLKRSSLGRLYRRYWLYPWLCRDLRGRALDVGCGIGDMLAFRADTIGVDINPHNVEICRRLGLNAQSMEVDRLPFEDRSFDSVLLDNVLEHVVNPAPLLAEVRRVLRPGGCAVIGVPGIRGQGWDPDHKVFYDEAGLERLAVANGFRVTRFRHMPLGRSSFLSRRLRQYCLYSRWVLLDPATRH